MATLEQEGEEVVGQARCPFESRQSNVGLFAGERGRPEGEAFAVTAANKSAKDTLIKQGFKDKDGVETEGREQMVEANERGGRVRRV